jgi:hypothetical protein
VSEPPAARHFIEASCSRTGGTTDTGVNRFIFHRRIDTDSQTVLRRDFRVRISEVSVFEEVMCGLSGAIDLRRNRVGVVRYFVHMGLVDAEFPELVETPDELVVAQHCVVLRLAPPLGMRGKRLSINAPVEPCSQQAEGAPSNAVHDPSKNLQCPLEASLPSINQVDRYDSCRSRCVELWALLPALSTPVSIGAAAAHLVG